MNSKQHNRAYARRVINDISRMMREINAEQDTTAEERVAALLLCQNLRDAALRRGTVSIRRANAVWDAAHRAHGHLHEIGQSRRYSAWLSEQVTY
jgi:hypothetical protein